MDVHDLSFPAIRFCQDSIDVVGDYKELTTVAGPGIRSGTMDGMLLVDQNGTALRIKTVRKVGYFGSFWSHFTMAGRLVIIELIPDGDSFKVDLEQLKRMVVERSDREMIDECADDDFESYERRVVSALSALDVMKELTWAKEFFDFCRVKL